VTFTDTIPVQSNAVCEAWLCDGCLGHGASALGCVSPRSIASN
jgi:hypothetical protein